MVNDTINIYSELEVSALFFNYFYLNKEEVRLLGELNKINIREDIGSILDLNEGLLNGRLNIRKNC